MLYTDILSYINDDEHSIQFNNIMTLPLQMQTLTLTLGGEV